MKITIIFDKEKIHTGLECGWGIAYLIGDVLFDTTEKPEYLTRNMTSLGIDVRQIKKVVISHNNWDHRAGLWELLTRKEDIEVCACSDFLEEFKDAISMYNCRCITDFCQISPGIFSSGCVKTIYKKTTLLEQFLLVKTPRGLSLAFGCAHPGILAMIHKAKECFPNEKIYAVFGGFHLMESDTRMIRYIANEMKKIGIEKVGPSHCSGYDAVSVFKEIYCDDLIEIKTGLSFDV